MEIEINDFYTDEFTDVLKPSCYMAEIYDDGSDIASGFDDMEYENLYALPQ